MDTTAEHIIPLLLNRSCFSKKWNIQTRPDGERGIFATKDLKAGDILFTDSSVLIGPKNSVDPVCSCCYQKEDKLEACKNGCSLPLCEDCNLNMKKQHEVDCRVLKKWQIDSKSWSLNSFKALTPIRALYMNEDDKRILKSLRSHNKNSNLDEVDQFCKYLDNQHLINEQDEEFMHHVCRILRTNSFEVPILKSGEKGKNISYIRGIYPLAAMLNHSCCPNVRHSFLIDETCMNQDLLKENKKYLPPILELCLRQNVKKGEELFMTYCDITDITSLRRKKMFITKGFWCQCERCKDKTEFKTYISAYKCTNKEEACPGLIVPENPLKEYTHFICLLCKNVISAAVIQEYHTESMALLKCLEIAGLQKIIPFLSNEDDLGWLPKCNFVYIKLKIYLISNLGYQENYRWNELLLEHITLKRKACEDILKFLNDVNYGKSTLYGSILLESQKCIRLLSSDQNDLKTADRYLKEAQEILKNDVTALLD